MCFFGAPYSFYREVIELQDKLASFAVMVSHRGLSCHMSFGCLLLVVWPPYVFTNKLIQTLTCDQALLVLSGQHSSHNNGRLWPKYNDSSIRTAALLRIFIVSGNGIQWEARQQFRAAQNRSNHYLFIY